MIIFVSSGAKQVGLVKRSKQRPSHHAFTPRPEVKPIKKTVTIKPEVPALEEKEGEEVPAEARGKGDIGLRLDQLRPVKEKLIEVEIWSRAGVGKYIALLCPFFLSIGRITYLIVVLTANGEFCYR